MVFSVDDDLLDGNRENFAIIADALRSQGYVVLRDGLPQHVGSALTTHFQSVSDDAFLPAQVGRGVSHGHHVQVRRDKIFWIDARSSLSRNWLAWIDELKTYLNQHLFLGLFSFESHFASYGPGDFYQTHVDAFHGESNRIVSLVTYLNSDWRQEFGGELVIYDGNSGAELVKVLPEMGTLVLFLSEEFPHEVKPATQLRVSVAGWFRINTSISTRVDPPA